MERSKFARLGASSLNSLVCPEDLRVWEWAQKRRIMPGSVTAKSGPYDLDWTPYMKEPQEAFFDPQVQTTVLCMASRTGKTEGLLNLAGFTADHDPCHFLMVYPTQDSGKKFKKEFLTPMFDSSPCFRGKIADPKSRDGENTMFGVTFPGGRLSVIGANSPSAFRQIQAPRVVCDEIDAMEGTVEGDPVALAFRRADNYQDSVQVVSSTPTAKGTSRIWAFLESSDFRRWHVSCPHCKREDVMAWSWVKWDNHDARTARVECPQCGGVITDEQRAAMVRAGRWIASKPFTGIRGYWANGMVSLFPQKKGFVSKAHQWAQEYIDALKAGSDAMQVWINTFLAECYEEAFHVITPESIGAKAHDFKADPLPAGVLLLTAGVDVQADRIEVSVFGWGIDEECWGIEYRRIYGDPDKDEIWQQLSDLLDAEYRSELGGRMIITRCFVDSGFKPERVYDFTLPRAGRGVFACRGHNKVGPNPPPLLGVKPSTNNKAGAPVWYVGVTVAKGAIYDRIAAAPGGARTVHFPAELSAAGVNRRGFDDQFFKELTAERIKTRYSYGTPYRVFEKVKDSDRNEALDTFVYALAAMYSLMPILWHRLSENIKRAGAEAAKVEALNLRVEIEKPERAEEAKPEPVKQEAPRPPAPIPSRQGGWISHGRRGGWMGRR